MRGAACLLPVRDLRGDGVALTSSRHSKITTAVRPLNRSQSRIKVEAKLGGSASLSRLRAASKQRVSLF